MVQPSSPEALLEKVESLKTELAACRETMAALQQGEEHYRELVENANDLIHSISPDGKILYANRAWYDTLGYSQEELRQLSLMDIIDESKRASCRNIFQCYLSGERLGPNETILIARDGRRVNVEGRCHLQVKDGRPVALLSIFRDITERKKAEAALRESEQRYRGLFENAHDLIQILRPNGGFLFVNRAWQEVLGYSEEEVRHLQIFDLISPECQEHCREGFQRMMAGESLDNVETEFVTKDGRKVILEGNAHCRTKDGEPAAVQCIFRDVTERRKAEEALRESEERYRELFENAHDLIQFLDPSGRFLFVNRAWLEIMGYTLPEVQQMGIFDVLAPGCLNHCQETFQRMMAGEPVKNIEAEFLTKDGRKVSVEGNAHRRMKDGRPVAVQCIFHDISERKRMEKEQLRSQKLESIGIFAGGIAHDFNNLLTAILGNLSLAQVYATPDQALSRKLQETEKATLRAKALTQQLLTFSKGGAPVKQALALSDLLPEASNFALRGSNVKCTYQLPEDLWPVQGDPGQLSQVMQNLVLNADQAMPEGGTILISAVNTELAEQQLENLPAGPYVRILVEDQGAGIPEKYLSKIFDPYFSTKQKGGGLGLAVVYSVVKNHGGHIAVDSRLGEGTTFTIYLPASVGQERATFPPEEEIFFGRGRILVMDDEAEVRSIAVELLKFLGYEPEAVADGSQALELYRQARQEGNPFDAVLMDLTIPGGMGGKEAIQELLRIDPQVKAIVSSGYANNPIMANHTQYGFQGVTPKPYRLQELSKTLHEVL